MYPCVYAPYGAFQEKDAEVLVTSSNYLTMEDMRVPGISKENEVWLKLK